MSKRTVYISFYLFLLIFIYTCSYLQKSEIILTSPDQTVSVQLFSQNGQLNYLIKSNNETLIDTSELGIVLNNTIFGKEALIGNPFITKIDEQYETRGNHRIARNYYIKYDIPFYNESTKEDFRLEFRVYNNGVAYRYRIHRMGNNHIQKEISSWKFPENHRVWFFERKNNWKLKSYAGNWINSCIDSLPTISPTGPIQGIPLVIETGKQYLLISEAALYNYSGMRVKAIGNRTLQANFTEDKGFWVQDDVITPWRVTIIANDLNELVNNDLIENLNPKPDSELFSNNDWVKPGKAAWRWWSLGTGTPAEEKVFVDYASQLEFQYTILDEGWEDWEDNWNTLKEFCDYANEKSIDVFVWKHSKEIEEINNDYQTMRTFLDKVKKSGAKGIKIDFMNAESKDKIDFEIKVLEEAAKRQLLVNFHGCHQASGESRTYPNEITREGIRGLELNIMNVGPLSASHNAALPFTRFAVGQADYTPVGFTSPGPTTWAHQLATLIVFYSPLQVIAEDIRFLYTNENVRPALEIIKEAPTVWDETIVLPGSKIGDLAAFARRSGEQWFVGILNGGEEREYSLDLSFLDSKAYKILAVKDDLKANPIDLRGLNRKAKLKEFTSAIPFYVENDSFTQNKVFNIRLAKGGGSVLMLTPTKDN